MVYLKNLIFFSLLFLFLSVEVRAECVNLYAGDADEKIDIIVLSYGYGENGDFVKFIEEVTYPSFLSIEPLKSNIGLFNFWYNATEKFSTRETGDAIDDELLSECVYKNGGEDFKNLFIVKYVNKSPTLGDMVGHANIGLGATILLQESKRDGFIDQQIEFHKYLFLHEVVGHAIAELNDEYILSSESENLDKKKASDQLNCFVGTYEQCLERSDWSDMIGDGCGKDGIIDCVGTPDEYLEVACYEGCRLLENGAYRPHLKSIMNEQKKDFFGLFHQKQICVKLEEMTHAASGYCFDQFGIGVESEGENVEDAAVVVEHLENSWWNSKRLMLTLLGFLVAGTTALLLVYRAKSG